MKKMGCFNKFIGRCGVMSITVVLALLTFVENVFAEGFNKDGLHYEIIPGADKTCVVTTWWSSVSKFTNLEIPSKITDDNSGEQYVVAGISENAFHGCDYLEEVSIPESVTKIGVAAFSDCTSLKTVSFPKSLVEIPDDCFAGCESLTTVALPDGLKKIGYRAFEGCMSLQTMELPSTLNILGEYAFKNCSGLNAINIPDLISELSEGLFYNCFELTNVGFPDSLTRLNASVFEGCTGLKSISLPMGVKEIGESVFAKCNNLASIELPDFLTKIGKNAFLECISLESVDLPDSISEIGIGAFYRCSSLKSIVIPNSITVLNGSLFYECFDLKSVILPEELVEIRACAFQGCLLTTVTFPASLRTIGVEAFYRCGGFKGGIYVKAVEPPYFEEQDLEDGYGPACMQPGPTFNDYCYDETTLYVPVGSIAKYKAAYGWNQFKNIVEMDFSKVDELEPMKPKIYVSEGNIVIAGFNSQIKVEVFNLSGETVYAGYDYCVSGLAEGIYIVRADGVVKKIIIK